MLLGVTVEEVLRLDVFRNSRLVAGKGGLGRFVTNVNVMEVPDILDWVREGELLLTTGFPIKDDPVAQERLIPELARRGLAGLGIKTKRYLDTIPHCMIRAADELEFPLVELSPETSHPLILRAVFTLLLSRQAEFVQLSLRTHELLLDAMLQGGGLSRISAVLAELLDNPVLVADAVGSPLAFAGGRSRPVSLEYLMGDPGGSLLGLLELAEGAALREEAGDLLPQRAHRYMVPVGPTRVGCVVVPVVASKRVRGYVAVWELNRAVDRSGAIAVERAAISVALELANQDAIRSLMRRYQSEFLEDLLSGDFESEEVMIQRGRNFGWDLTRNYVLLLVRPQGLHGAPLDQEARYDLMERIEGWIRLRYENSIVGTRGDHVVVLLDASPDARSAKNKVMAAGAALKREIEREVGKVSLAVAAGRFYPGVRGLGQAYRDARKVLAILEKSAVSASIMHFDDLGVYRLLFRPQTEMDAFLEETVGPLMEHDRAHGTELVKTLESYFECNGNVKKMASRLYTHYNTVIYRLRRIEGITGLDLRDPEARLNLQMGLKIARLRNYTKLT